MHLRAATVHPAGKSEAIGKHDVTQMLQLWRSRERIKSSRANRTSKGAEKWLDVQEHQHGTAACISYLKVCLAHHRSAIFKQPIPLVSLYFAWCILPVRPTAVHPEERMQELH